MKGLWYDNEYRKKRRRNKQKKLVSSFLLSMTSCKQLYKHQFARLLASLLLFWLIPSFRAPLSPSSLFFPKILEQHLFQASAEIFSPVSAFSVLNRRIVRVFRPSLKLCEKKRYLTTRPVGVEVPLRPVHDNTSVLSYKIHYIVAHLEYYVCRGRLTFLNRIL